MLFNVTSLSRAAGRSAPAAAAYRAGERLRDDGRRLVYDHSRRSDIDHREILVPGARAAAVPDWVQDRNQLWNAAEAAETRVNSRVAREYLVALPHELSATARIDLARRFAQTLADRYATVVDLAAHQPRPAGDPRNFHAHLLATTREITADGLGAKAVVELGDATRRGLGLQSSRDELRTLRSAWSEHANEALRAAGLELRLDPRTLKAQGIERLPQIHVPMTVVQMERRGIATQFMQSVREQLERETQLGALTSARAFGPEPRSVEATRPGSVDERLALARERWEAYRTQIDARTRDAGAERAIDGLTRNDSRGAARDAGLEWGG